MKNTVSKIIYFLLISISTQVISINTQAQVLPLREQAKVIDAVLENRLNQLLPTLMEKNNIDMWVIISREYNEDPVLKTMLPATWLSARRRTILVFYNNPTTKVYKKFAVARYSVGDFIEANWDMKKFPNQWDALNNIIETYHPKKIALNTSPNFGHADGLDHTEYEEFTQKLSVDNKAKVVSASNLAVAWLETRTPMEMQYYSQLNSITHKIIAEGFSSKVITPGITTTDDLVWWFRQKVNDLGLNTWFHPSVEIQRNDNAVFDHLKAFTNTEKENIIRTGDLLHVDFGISYLRLNTDVQEHAYVLGPDEKEAPSYLTNGLKTANRLQDILTQQFKENKTGNQILSDALAQSKKENIKGVIYTHPLGFHGHAAGPTIGMWDNQNATPGSGDYPMHYKTAYSIELNAATFIKEWNKEVRFMLEQNGYFDEKGFWYLDGRQTKLHLIGGGNN
jgi:hypothetical protein